MLVAFPDGASEPYCDACAVEMRAEAAAERRVLVSAEMAAELARVEALTAWLREHVRPPPADLLYHAADAVSRLRALLEGAA